MNIFGDGLVSDSGGWQFDQYLCCMYVYKKIVKFKGNVCTYFCKYWKGHKNAFVKLFLPQSARTVFRIAYFLALLVSKVFKSFNVDHCWSNPIYCYICCAINDNVTFTKQHADCRNSSQFTPFVVYSFFIHLLQYSLQTHTTQPAITRFYLHMFLAFLFHVSSNQRQILALSICALNFRKTVVQLLWKYSKWPANSSISIASVCVVTSPKLNSIVVVVIVIICHYIFCFEWNEMCFE